MSLPLCQMCNIGVSVIGLIYCIRKNYNIWMQHNSNITIVSSDIKLSK